ncbi:MAG: hypothetical protein OEZ16_02170 [Chromatiales bacterium]|nr:hypothetical protein [Chromatiales bacterium]
MRHEEHLALTEQVQQNCHLSDAHFARDYSLCIYLLKMREFYRWEQGIAFGEPLPKGPLGEWLTAREAHWETIEESDFVALELDQTPLPPFESAPINQRLVQNGMVYSGGYCGDKPHFFLAELEQVEKMGETTIYISGHELARELTAPPAMSLGNTIFLRRESLRRMIWEKLEEWGWQDPNRAIARAAAYYDFDSDLLGALDAITDDELNTLLQHELGELAAGELLGGEWEAMLTALPRSREQFQLRAIRDHLVDCEHTLPRLLHDGREAAIHFYFANFTTMRRAIFPLLHNAYLQWLDGGDRRILHQACRRGAEHWRKLADEALGRYRHGDGKLRKRLQMSDEELML